MTAGRYLEGVVLLCAALIPMAMAARAWRARLLPEWTGSLAVLAEVVIGLAAVVVVSELLGAAHVFRLWAVAPALGAVGLLSWWVARRTSRPPEQPPAIREVSSGRGADRLVTASILAIGVLIADWSARTVDAVHHGMSSPDTLWYHMPFAARFVQQGTIIPLHYVDAESVTVFFPATSELFHALGILFMGSDILSPFVNMFWMALALLGAWCAGRPFKVAPLSMTGMALLLVTPGLVATQPGGAYDDVVGLALLTSCAALLINGTTETDGRFRVSAQCVAALAAGVALGTKFTFIIPVAALTVGIAVLAPRGRRLRELAVWILLLFITGGFWYVRNTALVGNPLPSLHLGIGSIALPSPSATTPSSSFAHFISSASSWRHYFLPGLRLSFGPVWWAVLALAGVGLVIGILMGSGAVSRMICCVGVATAAGFVVMPQYLAILGAPIYFVNNIRYVDPAVAFGLVMLPTVPAVRADRRRWWLLGLYLTTIALTQLDGSIWPTGWLHQQFAPPVSTVDSLIGLLMGTIAVVFALLLRRKRRHGRVLPPVVSGRWLLGVGAVLLALLVAGFGLQRLYFRDRYVGSSSPSIVRWAQHVSGARIGVAGEFTQLQYKYYGPDESNFVQYVAHAEPHQGYAPISTCKGWRTAVNQGGYRYLITTNVSSKRRGLFASPSSYTTWTESDPSSTLLHRDVEIAAAYVGGQPLYVGVSLFKLTGDLDATGCAR